MAVRVRRGQDPTGRDVWHELEGLQLEDEGNKNKFGSSRAWGVNFP
jgi:hypothetical protein